MQPRVNPYSLDLLDGQHHPDSMVFEKWVLVSDTPGFEPQL